MELEAYGDPVGESFEQNLLSGVFDTNYHLIQFDQHGNHVDGCYDWHEGVLSGSTDGRVIRFEWRQTGPYVGTAIMVVTADGTFVNGLWYDDEGLKGTWFGPKVTDGRKPRCQIASKASLGKSLEETGRAILYGIYFDSNSAAVKTQSTQTLQQVADELRRKAGLRIVIEGHTDSVGVDEYNLGLSRKRAQAVRDWLIRNGIDAAKLEAEGYGELRPRADNATPHGRALNRRVEIAVIR
jgi:outer membrane protein OmpA-like peptidoglycan-associated protein